MLRCEKCGVRCACLADRKRPHLGNVYYYRCEKQDRVAARPRCRPNHIRSEPLDDLVWNEVRRHLLDPALLLQAQATINGAEPFDESVLSTQLLHTDRRLVQIRAERRRFVDAYQGGYISKQEFEERTRIVANRITELESDRQGLEARRKQAADGNQLLSGIRAFRSKITYNLDQMSFHQRQALTRKVLEEVVNRDNVVELYFKIPLPAPRGKRNLGRG